MNERQLQLLVSPEYTGMRLDHYLAAQLPEFSRSQLQNMLKNGDILLDGKQPKVGCRLRGNERLIVSLREAAPARAAAEDISLDIFYEDGDIIVVNKPQGMVVHPAAGHAQGTLVNALLHHCGDLSGIGGVIRPGIVHRIDKDTSGLLVAAKNDAAHLALSAEWKRHAIKRVYHALLSGVINENAGTVDAPVGRHSRDRKKMSVAPRLGRDAISHYRVLERFPLHNCTYAELELETGRTHQIRVHMAHLGHPVLGDKLYGAKKQPYALSGQALHAKVLGFHHPASGEYLEFESDLPDYFQALLAQLRGDKR